MTLLSGAQIRSASLSMVDGAKSDYMELHTCQCPLPVRAVPGVRWRSIFSAEYLETEAGQAAARTAIDQGAEVRAFRNLRSAMKLVDEESALVPVPTGDALHIRSPAVVRALREYYELLWARASPVTETLSDVHRQLVLLMSLGLKDESIANRTGMSLRTVRRHIATIMQTLSAETRFAAGVAAAKRGLLD